MSILNEKNVDTTTQPIFLGEPLSLQRFDRFKYPEFMKLFRKQVELFWTPEEFDLTKDRLDYEKMSEVDKFIFTKNLQYQTMMDSVVARGANTFIKHVSIPELEAAMSMWAMMETIHSYSYSYIIRNVYPDPAKIFDETLEDEEIMKRARTVKEEYEKLENFSGDDIKKQIYLSLLSVNILEAIRFYVSFVCSFSFNQRSNMMEGNTNIIKKILADETTHYRMSQYCINLLHKEKDEGFLDVVKECRDIGIQMYLNAAEEEKEWADYLFSRGPMVGLSAETLKGYIEWLCDTRMQAIGFPKHYETKNPIHGWLEPYINDSMTQSAPQETSGLTTYKRFVTDNDLGDFNFEL